MKKTQINGKIVHAHGPEELILLKYSCYPKPYIDYRQFHMYIVERYSATKNKKILPSVITYVVET